MTRPYVKSGKFKKLTGRIVVVYRYGMLLKVKGFKTREEAKTFQRTIKSVGAKTILTCI